MGSWGEAPENFGFQWFQTSQKAISLAPYFEMKEENKRPTIIWQTYSIHNLHDLAKNTVNAFIF